MMLNVMPVVEVVVALVPSIAAGENGGQEES